MSEATSAPLRVLFLRNLYWPEDFGGNRYPLEVTTRLARRGHVVRVVTGRPSREIRTAPPEGVDIRYFSVRRGNPLATHATNAVASVATVGQALRELRPDVALVSSWDVGLGYFFRRHRPPSAFIYHSGFRSDAVERLKRRGMPGRLAYSLARAYVEWLEAHVLRSAERVVAVSDFSAEEIVQRVPAAAERIVRIPTGVDTAFFAPGDVAASRARLGIPADRPVLVVVGRLMPVKRYDRAIDALAALHASGLPALLLIVGEGPERSLLETRAREAGLGEAVRFLGFRTGSELRDALLAADLQLCTSEFENLSLALLEGLATGTPVVSVPTGGTIQLLSEIDPALLAAATDPVAIAERAGTWLRDPEGRASLSRRARGYVVAEHDWASVVDRLEAQLLALKESTRP